MEKQRSSLWTFVRLFLLCNLVFFNFSIFSSFYGINVQAQPVQFGEQPNGVNNQGPKVAPAQVAPVAAPAEAVAAPAVQVVAEPVAAEPAGAEAKGLEPAFPAAPVQTAAEPAAVAMPPTVPPVQTVTAPTTVTAPASPVVAATPEPVLGQPAAAIPEFSPREQVQVVSPPVVQPPVPVVPAEQAVIVPAVTLPATVAMPSAPQTQQIQQTQPVQQVQQTQQMQQVLQVQPAQQATSQSSSSMPINSFSTLIETDREPASVAPSTGSGAASGFVGGASGLVEKVYHAQIKSDNANLAKKKMIEEAIFKTSEALIQELIGPARYQKAKTDIQDKVHKQTGRFIPVMKTGELSKDAEGNYILAVTMQVSLRTLETILREQGLLYEREATPIILPLVNYQDQVQNKTYRWWRSVRDVDLSQQYSNLEKHLQKNFSDQGFYVERPNSSGLELLRPTAFDREIISPEDWKQFAQLYKVSVLIEGDIRIVALPEYPESMGIEIQLLARQVATGKVLAELYRKGQWDKRDFWNQKRVQQWVDSTFKDLAVQVNESWQRGTFSSSVLKLIVKGGLPLSRFQKFKEQIQSQSRSVRQIRERVIGADELVFDIEVTDNSGDLSRQLQSVVFDDQKYQFIVADAYSITLEKNPK